MIIHESAEDYLEAVLKLRTEKGIARSIDIAGMLHVTKPSVSIAMKKLRESGYVYVEENGSLALTPQGEEIAKRIYERHRVLTEVLMALGVDAETASEEACKIEHDLSDDTFARIKKYFHENAH